MAVTFHPPDGVSFEGLVSEDDRRRIDKALRQAVQRALEKSAAQRVEYLAARRKGEVAELFDTSRVGPTGTTYLVPSYDDKGQPSETELLENIPLATQVYGVQEGPSRLEGRLILQMPGNRYVFLHSPRYAVSSSLTLAYEFGVTVFGASSFAILQGPWESKLTQYLTVGTDPSVNSSDLGRPGALVEKGEHVEVAGQQVSAWGGTLLPSVKSDIGTYVLRGFVTEDRSIRYPDLLQLQEWRAQTRAEAREGVQMPQAPEAREMLFGDLDKLVDQYEGGDYTNLQKAADYLARFDANAFSLVPWDRKVAYLKVLLAAWTWQEQERAVVQIFKSLRSDSEVDVVVDELKRAGRYDQLFNDLDNELYELLVTVGEKFPKDRSSLTFEGLVKLLASMGIVTTAPLQYVSQVYMGPGGTLAAPAEMLDEAHDAVMGLVRFGIDLGESLLTIFTDPDKVVEGIGAMVQLIVKVQLANWGYPPAVLEISRMLAGLAQKILAGMRGAERLGAEEKVVRRIKWRLVWEIASLFIGAGEVKAVIQAAELGEKLAGVIRFLGVLARFGEVVDAEAEGVRLTRLVAMLAKERAIFGSVEEAAELMSRLPESDVQKLGELLAEFDFKEGETLADLAARSPKLHAAVEDAAAKMEVLKTLAGKSGRLSEESIAAFQRLVGPDGLEAGAAHRVVAAIPEGEGARFAATLERIPLERLTSETRSALLEMLAGSTRRMDVVTRLGLETFGSVYRRAAGKAEAVDAYLRAVEELERRLTGEGKAADLRRILDALERDDPGAWLTVENERLLQAGQRAISDWISIVEGSPQAQAGLDRLLRRGHDDVVSNMLTRESEQVVRGQLEQIAQLSDHQADGLAALKRVEADLGGDVGGQWHEVLDLTADFRNPMLDLVADIERSVDGGLDLAIKRGVTGNHNDIQGTLGHLFAARTLRDRFPGARFRFELHAPRREIDIQMHLGGRQIDVEVKTNLGLEPTVNNTQIYNDLERHIGDQWADMLYLYAPQQAGNTAAVERAMLRNLARLHAEGKLPAGMSLAQASGILQNRISAGRPWRLVDVFAY